LDSQNKQRFETHLEKLGYSIIQTGGNCTAWWKQFDEEEITVLLTHQAGHCVPETLEDPVLIGIYDTKEYNDGNEERDIYEFDRLGDVPFILLAMGGF